MSQDLTFDPVELAQRLIRIDTTTPDSGEALALIQRHLDFLGFSCLFQTFHEGGGYPVPNLYARLGTQGPHFCFAGHTDVVPPGQESMWTFPPFEAKIANGLLYGRGAADMKGAIAAFISAVHAYLQEGSPKGSLSFLLTGDEEAEALNGTRPLLQWIDSRGEKLDACLIGEASCETVIGDTLKIGRRGSLSGFLTVKGQQGHVAYPHLADNPLRKLVAVLNRLYETPLDQGNESFPPSGFEVTSIDTQNKAMNVIPAKAQAHFNIRYNPQQTEATLIEKIHAYCQQMTQEYTLEWLSRGVPFYTPPGLLTETLQEAIQHRTGIIPRFSTSGGTSDGRFIHTYCPVVEFGVVNQSIHKMDEHVPVQDLYTLRDIYTQALVLFFTKHT